MPAEAAAPPAPAPATPPPAAPPAPAAKSTPPVTTAKAVSHPAQDLADAYSQLDRMASPEDKQPAPRKEVPKAPKLPEGQKPQQATKDGKPVPNEDEGEHEDDAAKAPDEAETPPPAPPEGKEKAATLRQRKEQLEKENATLAAKVKELEGKTFDPSEHPEFKKLKETHEAKEKRLAELEDEIRFTNYERSTEYKEKYEAPFIDAYAAGRERASKLKVLEQRDEADEITQAARAGTPADFDTIMRITDDNDAGELAAKLFGHNAPYVMFHREEVNKLNGVRVKALEQFRKDGSVREAQRTEAMTKAQKENVAAFEAAVKDGVEKYGKWFKPVEGDKKSAEILERGFQFADIVFGKEVKGPDGQPIKPSTAMAAAIRNKAGGFDHAVYLLNQERATVKELRAKLKEYEASEPGPGNGATKPAKTKTTADIVEEGLRKYVR